VPKKEIEISYRANRDQLRSEFAQGGFWFMVRSRVDDGKNFQVIEDAYVNARLLRGLVDVAVTPALRASLLLRVLSTQRVRAHSAEP
jgi:hypothetical protein